MKIKNIIVDDLEVYHQTGIGFIPANGNNLQRPKMIIWNYESEESFIKHTKDAIEKYKDTDGVLYIAMCTLANEEQYKNRIGSVKFFSAEEVKKYAIYDNPEEFQQAYLNHNTIDIKYLGIPNICFSITNQDDKREAEYAKQRMSRGFDNSELWSLRDTIARFIHPRLKAFAENNCSIPYGIESEDWINILNKMIRAFELVFRDDGSFILTDEEQKEYDEGFKLFYEYFLALWD